LFPNNEVCFLLPQENAIGLIGVQPLGINFFEPAFGVVKKIQSELVGLSGLYLKFGEKLILISIDVGSLGRLKGNNVTS